MRKSLGVLYVSPRSTRTFSFSVPASVLHYEVDGLGTVTTEAVHREPSNGVVTIRIRNPYDYQVEVRPMVIFDEPPAVRLP